MVFFPSSRRRCLPSPSLLAGVASLWHPGASLFTAQRPSSATPRTHTDPRVAFPLHRRVTLGIAAALHTGRSSSDATPGDPNRVEEPLKVDEAETVNMSPPSPDKLLVLGGSGFVGSHVCKEALDRGFVVSSLNRSGKPSISEPWVDKVTWNKGNLLEPASFNDAMDDISAVVSCVGAFGTNSVMYKINGTANINAIRIAAEKGVKRFVYVSAADFGLVNYVLQGYYEGKRAAEAELLLKFTYGGVILRPGFVYGTRRVGSVNIPLGLVGSPMQMVLQNAKSLTRLPLVGPLLTPPVSVTSVAAVAVRAATDPVFPPGIVDAYSILRYSERK